MYRTSLLERRFLMTVLGLVLTFLACNGYGQSIMLARVVRVPEGDLITVVNAANQQQEVRIAGIDAPARFQSFGGRAQQNLAALVSGLEVTVEWSRQEPSGSIIGKVLVAPPNASCRYQSTCPKTMDVGLEQVAAGMAWWHEGERGEQTEADRGSYQEAEFQAKIHRRGLWAEKNPMPPWLWRR